MPALERDLLEEFLLDCRLRNLSPRTIDWYREMLGRALDAIAAQGPSRMEEVRAAHIRQFIADLLDWDRSVRTINGYARALNVFCNYLVSEGLLECSPTEWVAVTTAARPGRGGTGVVTSQISRRPWFVPHKPPVCRTTNPQSRLLKFDYRELVD